ncbi:MAG: TrmH family RNA methyltransferase, partial [Thermomicrobiales bacterium]
MERAFIVEGERAIQDALVAGAMPAHILLSHDWQPHIANLQEQLERVPPHLVHHVDSALMPQLADTVTPSGILAVFPFPNPKEPPGTPLVVIADGLGDPGNLGTLIRTAAAAGATRVILAGQTVDAFNPKVVRAGMGAHFHIPIQVLHGENDLSSIRQIPFRILAESGKHPPPEAIKWTGPTLLIIGGEAAGAGATSQELAT